MATSDNKETIAKKPSSDKTEEDDLALIECAICLQSCIYPVQLPCKHIFCFLCVKGATTQSKRCAMCRAEIPPDYLDHPELISSLDSVQECIFEDGFQWFYEGRNGWWLYDERTGLEIEQFYKSGEKKCELLIAGFLYIIDFEHMMQFRRNDPNRRRQIKRDAASVPKKGVAGLRAKTFEEGTNVPAITTDADGENTDGHNQTPNSDSQRQQQQLVISQHRTRQAHHPPAQQPSALGGSDHQISIIRGPDQQQSTIRGSNQQPSVIRGPDQQPSVIRGPDQQQPVVRRQDQLTLAIRRQDQQQLSHSMRSQQHQPSLNRRPDQESPLTRTANQQSPIVRSQDAQVQSVRGQDQPSARVISNRTQHQPITAVTSRSMNQPRPMLGQPEQLDSTSDNTADDISQPFSNLSVRVSSSLPNSGFYWGGSSPSDDPLPSYQNIQNVEANLHLMIPPNQQNQPSLQQRSPQRRSQQ